MTISLENPTLLLQQKNINEPEPLAHFTVAFKRCVAVVPFSASPDLSAVVRSHQRPRFRTSTH
jgi:hypothetical protein